MNRKSFIGGILSLLGISLITKKSKKNKPNIQTNKNGHVVFTPSEHDAPKINFVVVEEIDCCVTNQYSASRIDVK